MTRLFHVSDVHFGREDKAAVAWFDALVAAEQPDAVAMTGDLTMRARSHEFDAGLDWLKSLGRPVTLEVGNHDLPYWNMIDRMFRPYHRYHAIERIIEQPLDLPDVTIVPLKTTSRAQWRLNWSKGYVSRKALAKTLALIADAPRDRPIFVAAHHPLIEPHTKASAQTHRGAEAIAALAEAGADAVLTGHVHDAFDIAHDVAGRTIRMIGAGTLSERTRVDPPSFNEIRIADGAFEVICRKMGSQSDEVLPVEAPQPA
ncbi:metallophosphoesterase [Sphingomonas sp.]|jgi:3',5'-cyclic AMP phosphodiesterase CpdA|uniref:metallophosphoesterase family protein n=1 Tax=Sphingomonas sp. TaxID=28214 RepID=UPI002E36DCF9|nr:metallophosphoesterase [Sphingomonas sp.]HEX4694982.1 metallophosphoesterase [Sphingomonas sp.]